MDTLSYKTISANQKTASKEWILIDAENQVLGRVASITAKFLRGKYKTNFTPHADTGDYVVVINADKIRLTGNKWEQKEYIRHTGYPGGQRRTPAKEMMAKKPTAMFEKAVKGMLPKNKLGSQLFRNMHVFAGPEHTHQAQKPKKINLNSIK